MILLQGRRPYFTLSLMTLKEEHSVSMGYTKEAGATKDFLLNPDTGSWFLLLPVSKNKGSGYLRNVSTYIPKDRPSHPKRQETSRWNPDTLPVSTLQIALFVWEVTDWCRGMGNGSKTCEALIGAICTHPYTKNRIHMELQPPNSHLRINSLQNPRDLEKRSS